MTSSVKAGNGDDQNLPENNLPDDHAMSAPTEIQDETKEADIDGTSVDSLNGEATLVTAVNEADQFWPENADDLTDDHAFPSAETRNKSKEAELSIADNNNNNLFTGFFLHTSRSCYSYFVHHFNIPDHCAPLKPV